MEKSRRKEVRDKLLTACFSSSTVGIMGVIWFFFAAFNLTMTHVYQIFFPAAIVLAFDALSQFWVNERLLSRFFAWLEDEEKQSDKEWTRDAQQQMLEFPPKGSGASLVLWVVSAAFVALVLYVFNSAYSPRQLITMVVAISCGGLISMVFQFSIYKRIFRRHCEDLMMAQTGLHREQTTTIMNIRSKWLVGALVLLFVGMTYAGFLGNSRAAEAMMQRSVQLLEYTGNRALELAGQSPDDTETVSEYLKEASKQLDQAVFIFNDRGEAVYGKMPGEMTPGTIRDFLEEYDNWLVRILRIKDFYARNIAGSDNEFMWAPLNENMYVGSVFYRDVANQVLSGYNWSIFLLIVFFLGLGFFVAYLAATDISLPMARMLDLTDRISTGDLTENVNLLSEDEIGRLASGLQTMTEELRGMISRIDSSARHVEQAAHDIRDSQSNVSDGTKRQADSVEETDKIAGEMSKIVNNISDNIEIMAENARESAKAIIEMEAASNELSDNVRELSSAVESTSSAIFQMNASVKEINEGLEVLNNVAEETASATMQMDQSINQVEESARETLRLSETVTEDSTTGVTSVQSTITGIGRIEEGVREASEVILHLGEHAEEIGKIVNVINEIADQTNLLALNAAIIAAQAGERGRSFAVVADEIKKLSERTTSSTKEIRELIASVQGETQRAITVMQSEAQSVEEGVNLAFQAGQALEKIQKSAQRSSEMANQIASATTEQAAGSKRVTDAVAAIAERVSRIAASMREQARGADQITHASSEMQQISPMVRMKAQKQAEGGKQITVAMENITEMVNYVLKSQQSQQEQSEKILAAMKQIRNVLKANAETVSRLDATVSVLSSQSESLRTEVHRFKLPTGEKD